MTYLCLDEFIDILQGFGLPEGSVKPRVRGKGESYIVEHSLHERDGDLSLLHKIIFCILHFEPGGLLVT